MAPWQFGETLVWKGGLTSHFSLEAKGESLFKKGRFKDSIWGPFKPPWGVYFCAYFKRPKIKEWVGEGALWAVKKGRIRPPSGGDGLGGFKKGGATGEKGETQAPIRWCLYPRKPGSHAGHTWGGDKKRRKGGYYIKPIQGGGGGGGV